MNTAEIRETLRGLSLERPVFHSEADFKHAFAWTIQQRLPEARIRLEVPVEGVHVDAIVSTENSAQALELKYKTKAHKFTLGNEQFVLANHAAHPRNRYHFLKDICRIEALIQKHRIKMGWALMLTNEPLYWQTGRSTVGSDFAINEGAEIEGTRRWHMTASEGTTKGIEEPLVFSGSYRLRWEVYSKFAPQEIRYCLVEVTYPLRAVGRDLRSRLYPWSTGHRR
jgi:hypothetical protein